MTAVTVTYSRQPVVHQFCAEFTTPFGTQFQIIAFEGQSSVMFGVRNTNHSGNEWSYGTFGYAETWRTRNDYPVAWNAATFKRMVEAFMAEAKEDE